MKNPLTLSLILAIMFISAFSSGCSLGARMIEPEISVVGLSFQQASLLETKALFQVRVQNENDFPIEIRRSVHDLEVNGIKIGKGLNANGFSIPAFSSTTVPLDTNISNLSLLTRFKELGSAGALNYRITSTLHPSSGGRRMTLVHEGNFGQ